MLTCTDTLQTALIRTDKCLDTFKNVGIKLFLPSQLGSKGEKLGCLGWLPSGCLGYEDEEYYYLFFESTQRAVKKFCDDQGEGFTISTKALGKVELSRNVQSEIPQNLRYDDNALDLRSGA